jgi:hypothetical protein
VRDRLKAVGLGGIEGYVWGRAAALGEPTAGVVIAAFGVFDAVSLAQTYESARRRADRSAVLACREEGVAEALAAALGPSPDAGWVADSLLAATLHLDGTARPLFSGLRDLPVPSNLYGRLWRATDLVREYRGDGHLAACVAAGLNSVEMNVLTEVWVGYSPGEYSATRRHSPERIGQAIDSLTARGWLSEGALTAAGRNARDDIERATDASQSQLVHALGEDIEKIIDATSRMAALIIAAGAFTDDAKKRAAG